jgi:hypothetical protein
LSGNQALAVSSGMPWITVDSARFPGIWALEPG